MWRKPELDPTYGGEAINTYQTLLGLYPDSPYADSAQKQLKVLDEMFATKDYQTGMQYFRRKAYDSAVIYFRSVLDHYPQTQRVHDALLRLADVYDRLNYKEDKADICTTLRDRYPRDGAVGSACGRAPVATSAPAKRDTL